MNQRSILFGLLMTLFALQGVYAQPAAVPDISPHKVQFVTVDPGVKLEVLDWGGAGSPLIFLAGLGDTAHVFDGFAPEFTNRHHVYGITRRGFGASSIPPLTDENYDSDRLGDDVIAVIDSLHLDRPILAGHSIAGEELSSVATRHPEKIAGLIYLDAAYDYAFYVPGLATLQVDVADVRRKLKQVSNPQVAAVLLPSLLQTDLPRLQKDFEDMLPRLQAILQQRQSRPPTAPLPLPQQVGEAVTLGAHEYTDIKLPTLAVFVVSHDTDHSDTSPGAKLRNVQNTDQADAVEAGIPGAVVVRIPNASHYVFRSNEAEVADAMNDFMDHLDK